MTQIERFDMVILGSGEGGKLLAWHLGKSGKTVAVVERREVLGFSHHVEVTGIPQAEADALLDEAETDGLSIRALRERVKQVKAYLSQGWTADQIDRKKQVENGLCVVASMREKDRYKAFQHAFDHGREAARGRMKRRYPELAHKATLQQRQRLMGAPLPIQ